MQDANISSGQGRAKKRGPLRLGGRVALAAGLVAAGMVAIAPLGAQAAPSKAAKAAKAASFATNCGTKKVTLQGYFETGFNDIVDLTKLFTKQHPTVKWHIREDQFATITSDAPLLLAGPNAPDLMRMPQLNGLVKDHLLKNLDGYFKTFDWSKFPATQLASMRVAKSGAPQGVGPLWAMGANYSMTGVFFNKALAAQVGITTPPTDLADLNADMAKAKAAGVQPIEQFNGGGTGGLAFPLQFLMADYGGVKTINNWVNDQSGANINTTANVQATTQLQTWITDGYFNADANSTLYPQMMSAFEAGTGLFIFDGDWESGNFDTLDPGKYGFFLFPPLNAGGTQAAMSAPLTYGIPASAKHPACAAYFLNWVATNSAARKLNVTEGGSNPGGPPSLPIPTVKPGSMTSQTLSAGRTISKDNGAMGFIANATGAIYAEAWTPELQKLFGGQETPTNLLTTVQADYVQELSTP